MSPEPQEFVPAPYYSPSGVEIDPWNIEEAIKSQLPVLDQVEKLDYLLYRAVNFSIQESLQLINLNYNVLAAWRSTDPLFLSWEKERLPLLQSKVGPNLLWLQFTRNMRLAQKVDSDMLAKLAFRGPETLTKFEQELVKDALKRYGPGELGSFLKALNPGTTSEDPDGRGFTVNNYNLGQDAIEKVLGDQALAQEVLKRFTVIDEIVEGEVTQGDVIATQPPG